MRPAAVHTLSSTSSSPRSVMTRKQTTLQKRYVLLLHITDPVSHNKQLHLERKVRPRVSLWLSPLDDFWHWEFFFSVWVMWKVIRACPFLSVFIIDLSWTSLAGQQNQSGGFSRQWESRFHWSQRHTAQGDYIYCIYIFTSYPQWSIVLVCPLFNSFSISVVFHIIVSPLFLLFSNIYKCLFLPLSSNSIYLLPVLPAISAQSILTVLT